MYLVLSCGLKIDLLSKNVILYSASVFFGSQFQIFSLLNESKAWICLHICTDRVSHRYLFKLIVPNRLNYIISAMRLVYLPFSVFGYIIFSSSCGVMWFVVASQLRACHVTTMGYSKFVYSYQIWDLVSQIQSTAPHSSWVIVPKACSNYSWCHQVHSKLDRLTCGP